MLGGRGDKLNWSLTSISGPEVIKKFMLNSAAHEILNARKYKNIKEIQPFHNVASDQGLHCLLI